MMARTVEELNAAQRTALNKADGIVDAFRLVNPSIPSSYMKFFLLVAKEQGLGSSEYARRADTSQPIASRIILELGEKTRTNEPGMGLVEHRLDDNDMRYRRVYLTTKGKSLLRTIIKLME